MIIWLNRVYATITLDLTQFFRYKLAVTSSILTSVVMVLSFWLGMGKSEFMIEGTPYLIYVIPGILALGTMYSCIYSAGYSIIFDRQRRLIDDIILSPISYSAFIVGRILSALVKSIIQLSVFLIIAILLLNIPLPNMSVLSLAYCLTVVLFGAIGMILASFTDMISFGGFANIVTIPCMYFCGVFFPIAYYNKFIREIISFIPFTASIELFRYSFTGKTLVGTLSSNIMILLSSSVIFLILGTLAFRKAVKEG
jgi:ABC-2 type transport system permease protein